jgi:hypothetical protein
MDYNTTFNQAMFSTPSDVIVIDTVVPFEDVIVIDTVVPAE